MHNRTDAIKEGCSIGQMKDKKDEGRNYRTERAGHVGFSVESRTGGMQEGR